MSDRTRHRGEASRDTAGDIDRSNPSPSGATRATKVMTLPSEPRNQAETRCGGAEIAGAEATRGEASHRVDETTAVEQRRTHLTPKIGECMGRFARFDLRKGPRERRECTYVFCFFRIPAIWFGASLKKRLAGTRERNEH